MVSTADSEDPQRAPARTSAESRKEPDLPSGSTPRRIARTALGVAFVPVAVAEQLFPRSQPAFYYTGLAVAAAVDVLDWPVAAAIAAGVWVARNAGRGGRDRENSPRPQG